MAIYLTENGYTEYTKNTDDKRVKKIYLLEKGFQYYNEIFVSMNEEEQPMLEGMSLGEKIVFQELLQKVLLNSVLVKETISSQ